MTKGGGGGGVPGTVKTAHHTCKAKQVVPWHLNGLGPANGAEGPPGDKDCRGGGRGWHKGRRRRAAESAELAGGAAGLRVGGQGGRIKGRREAEGGGQGGGEGGGGVLGQEPGLAVELEQVQHQRMDLGYLEAPGLVLRSVKCECVPKEGREGQGGCV